MCKYGNDSSCKTIGDLHQHNPNEEKLQFPLPETRLLIKFKNIEMTISYCYYTKCVLYVILNIQDRMHVLFVCQKVISQAKKCLFNVM